jgi:large subunit ribosomal protein L4
MQLEVLNINGNATGKKVDLPEGIFGIEPNDHVLYLAVKAYLANQRQGTHKAKQRNEIAGSTRKLHKQKGTGGSRKGSIKNPLYHGGGRVHGPQPRDYSEKMNKKVKSLARRSALSVKMREGAIIVVEDFSFDAPKTSAYVNVLSKLKIAEKKSLLLTGQHDNSVYLSSRNIPTAQVVLAQNFNTYDVLNANFVVLTETALENIKNQLA